MTERKYMGRATALEAFSAMLKPMRFGTSSPKMMLRYVTRMMMMVWAVKRAYACGKPALVSRSEKSSASEAPE